METSWTYQSLDELYNLPFNELIYQAQTEHKKKFLSSEVQLSTLLNIKTGACPENCAYCPQSGHYQTGVNKAKLLSLVEVVEKAKLAKEQGATRFCMGAAWRSPPASDLPKVAAMIQEVKALGLETCVTLGMLDNAQTQILKDAGLDYYNHNIDTSPEFYPKIITSHTLEDRLNTIKEVANAGIKICCGGILGMGESHQDRLNFLLQLTQLAAIPESIPINWLIPIPGTPLANSQPLDNFTFIRIIALTRIVFTRAYVRLSAGRVNMSEETQALCFLAGANSIHFGEKLLMTKNNEANQDLVMLKKLNMTPKPGCETDALR